MCMRDDELVTAALAGDPAAFAALVEGNRARVETVVDDRRGGGRPRAGRKPAISRRAYGRARRRSPGEQDSTRRASTSSMGATTGCLTPTAAAFRLRLGG
jgi:hypothetical protein